MGAGQDNCFFAVDEKLPTGEFADRQRGGGEGDVVETCR